MKLIEMACEISFLLHPVCIPFPHRALGEVGIVVVLLIVTTVHIGGLGLEIRVAQEHVVLLV